MRMKIVPTGRLEMAAAIQEATREWENNEQNSRRTEIVATRVQFLDVPPSEAKGVAAVEELVPPRRVSTRSVRGTFRG
jgi:hypothetical protein